MDYESANAVCYLLSLAFLYWMERVWPYDPMWNDVAMDEGIDSQPGWQDVFHILSLTFNYAIAQTTIKAFLSFISYSPPLLPLLSSLPLPLSVFLSVHLAEIGYYWQHRFGHTFSLLWPFHAVHHQVLRVHVINAGRIHFFDQLTSNFFTFSLHYLAGFSDRDLSYVYGLYTICGMLSHCNIAMDTRVTNFIFNTPDLHRWHHSSAVSESNKNYGENLAFVDILCGTYHNPTGDTFIEALTGKAEKERDSIHGYGRVRFRDGAGILPGDRGRVFRLPKSFIGQVLAPFYASPLTDHTLLQCLTADCEK